MPLEHEQPYVIERCRKQALCQTSRGPRDEGHQSIFVDKHDDRRGRRVKIKVIVVVAVGKTRKRRERRRKLAKVRFDGGVCGEEGHAD
jgi:hypothetical protein